MRQEKLSFTKIDRQNLGIHQLYIGEQFTEKSFSDGLLKSVTRVSSIILEFFQNLAVVKSWVMKKITASISNQPIILRLMRLEN